MGGAISNERNNCMGGPISHGRSNMMSLIDVGRAIWHERSNMAWEEHLT